MVWDYIRHMKQPQKTMITSERILQGSNKMKIRQDEQVQRIQGRDKPHHRRVGKQQWNATSNSPTQRHERYTVSSADGMNYKEIIYEEVIEFQVNCIRIGSAHYGV